MRCYFAIIFGLASTSAFADLPVGEKKIVLSSASERIEIGTVNFTGGGSKRRITVTLNDKLLKDEFLSMRPFKCLESAKRYYCHVPYPYSWKGEVTEQDLGDLEYALLFVQKEPNAYGINLWNGVYYKMVLGADGTISGKLNEVDMDSLAVPPKDGGLRPLTVDMLNEATPEQQWLPQLSIK